MFEQWAQYKNGFLQARIKGISAVCINNLLEQGKHRRRLYIRLRLHYCINFVSSQK